MPHIFLDWVGTPLTQDLVKYEEKSREQRIEVMNKSENVLQKMIVEQWVEVHQPFQLQQKIL